MCRFASGFFKPDTMKLRVWDLNSHSKTAKHFNIVDANKLNDWREFHYTPEGEIDCRVLDLDAHTKQECESAMRARFPKVINFLNWAFMQKIRVDDNLYLRGLTLAEGLVLPQTVSGYLDLGGLTSAKGLVLPQTVGNLYLDGLTSAKDLVLPQTVCNLYLDGLTSAKGLVLPQTVSGNLDLGGLTSAKGLVLPQTVGYLYLNEDIKESEIPEKFRSKIRRR